MSLIKRRFRSNSCEFLIFFNLFFINSPLIHLRLSNSNTQSTSFIGHRTEKYRRDGKKSLLKLITGCLSIFGHY